MCAYRLSDTMAALQALRCCVLNCPQSIVTVGLRSDSSGNSTLSIWNHTFRTLLNTQTMYLLITIITE